MDHLHLKRHTSPTSVLWWVKHQRCQTQNTHPCASTPWPAYSAHTHTQQKVKPGWGAVLRSLPRLHNNKHPGHPRATQLYITSTGCRKPSIHYTQRAQRTSAFSVLEYILKGIYRLDRDIDIYLSIMINRSIYLHKNIYIVT